MHFDLPTAEILARPVQPEAAQAFWQSRASMTREEAQKLTGGAKARAFYVSGLAERDMVETVRAAIGEAIANGETLQGFKGRIGEVISRAGWQGHRVENIFRTNMQTAYAAGRYAKMQAVKEQRPYWQYYTIEDRRTRPSHAVLHGMVYPADHEFWGRNYPPNGFRCRCGVRTLSRAQVEAQGLAVQKSMPKDSVWTDPATGMEHHVQMPGADKGFRGNVGKDWMDGTQGLDLHKYPDLTPESYAEQRGNGIIQPVASNEDLARQIHQHAAPFALNGGVKRVAFDHGGYFMATNSHGSFYISQRTFSMKDGDFNPARELKSAWNKIASRHALTWHEEYAVEALWHEIMHNRQTPTDAGSRASLSRRMMEIVTQWTARRTYPRFLEALGGKAAHQARVLKEGYGYGHYIRNFDRLLAVLGVEDSPRMLEYFEEICRTQDRKKYQTAITDYLAKNARTPVKKSTLNAVLKATHLSAEGFETWLRFHALTS